MSGERRSDRQANGEPSLGISVVLLCVVLFAVVSCSIIPAGPSSPHHRLACSGLAGDLREWPSPGDVELFAAREAGPLPTSEATAASRAVRAKSSLIRSYADWWSVVDRPA
jgi:hypothetical protein